MPADGSSFKPVGRKDEVELTTSACPLAASYMGFPEPTSEDHTRLTVRERATGYWFTIETEDGCVEINADTFAMMARDGLNWLERHKAREAA